MQLIQKDSRMAERTLLTAGITGLGSSFPEKRLTNADLEKMVDTNDEWIVERTGISERRICEKGVGASVHGAEAALQAIANAGYTPEDIDLIVVGTEEAVVMVEASANQLSEDQLLDCIFKPNSLSII